MIKQQYQTVISCWVIGSVSNESQTGLSPMQKHLLDLSRRKKKSGFDPRFLESIKADFYHIVHCSFLVRVCLASVTHFFVRSLFTLYTVYLECC